MPYVTVPKDMKKVKTKFLLGLTKRQIICILLGVIVGLPIFFLLKPILGMDVSIYAMMGVGTPIFLFGFFERNGQPLEKILKNIIQTKFIKPQKRPYKTENMYRAIEKSTSFQKKLGKKSGLSSAEKKKTVEAINQHKKDLKVQSTAQKTIPYKQMFKDGTCQVMDKVYTRCIEFQDINFQLASDDDKSSIFEDWCDFLNFFSDEVQVQLSFVNQKIDEEDFQKAVEIPATKDKFNVLRKEYSDMLLSQLHKGDNNLIRTKYLTFSIEANSIKEARARLSRVESEILSNFKTVGCSAQVLNGYDRLEVLHKIFNPKRKFRFHWDLISQTGLSTKDFIAPDGFDFSSGKSLKMGEQFGAVSFISIDAPQASDRMLADLLSMNSTLNVNIHIHSINQIDAIKMVKRTLSNLEKDKIEEQKKAAQSGYDYDILPPELKTYIKEAEALLEKLQTQNEKMFLVSFYVMNVANNQQTLKNDIKALSDIVQKHTCALRRLDYQQEDGLIASIPLGVNPVGIERCLTTTSTAIFVPFTTQELFQRKGKPLYYGLNALSNNLIMVDRLQLRNPNGLILGTPGSGKSFAAKREIINVYLRTDNDILVIDPENEYKPLVEALDGQTVKISPVSTQYINPLDINLNYSDDDPNPLALKSEFILSFFELIIKRKDGLEAIEISIIDRCLPLIYENYLKDPVPENMPILSDLYNELKSQAEPEALKIATALEIYTTGSLNVFNNRTNVDITKRIVCFDIKELGNQLKQLGLLFVQDQVWNRVTLNRKKKATSFYIDEFHLLLAEERTAAYCVMFWKRFRKWGGIPTGITQNVSDLLNSKAIESIFKNSDFIYLLNQATGDSKILAEYLKISERQLYYVDNSNPGEGLIWYNGVIVPFVDKFPKDTLLYKYMTTRPDEVMALKNDESQENVTQV